jgi:hypothetical protein
MAIGNTERGEHIISIVRTKLKAWASKFRRKETVQAASPDI